MIGALPPLDTDNTLPVGSWHQRLALGLRLLDAQSGVGAGGSLRVELERIGSYACSLLLDRHRADRHALLYRGRAGRLLDHALAKGLGYRHALRIHAPLGASSGGYSSASDERRHVPRRLLLTPVLAHQQPVLDTGNIREIWLWPGSAYPLSPGSTVVRGRVLRGADMASAVAVPWARVFLTTPAAETNFAAAALIGRAHGDERGEFVLSVAASAAQGAALASPLTCRLWAWFAPPAPAGSDPLSLLPLEDAGSDALNDVLRGYTTPAGYTQSVSAALPPLHLGESLSGIGASLLYT